MRPNLPTPALITEARAQIRVGSKNRALDLLIQVAIFVLIFLVIGVAESVIAGIALIPMMLLDGSFIRQMGTSLGAGQTASSPDELMQATLAIMQSPQMMIISLFTTVIAIVVVLVYCRFIEKRRLATLGLRRGHAVREYLVGLAIGTCMFSAVVAIGLATGTMTYAGLAGGSMVLILLLLVGFLIQSMSEELLLRGYFLVSLANRQGLTVAIVISSCFFGLLHIFNPGVTPLAIVNIILFGLFAGVFLVKRGNIWSIGAIHAAWNFSQGGIFGINVSGTVQSESIFAFTPVAGADLISGGSFGMEAGLAATAVLVVALMAALLMKSRTPGTPATMSESSSP
ncbi:MAG TPA: hypothetical protein DEB24_01105 [Coriobacteriia bacterium]|nr:hypothetical protein [Coriobacteriia bacterium]